MATSKVRGILNKVTSTNVCLLVEEVKSIEFDDKSLLQCANLMAARAAEEQQNTDLIIQLVKGHSLLKPAFLEKIKMPNLTADCDAKIAVNKIKLICVVRSFGLISAAEFDGMLRQLINSDCEVVVECICALQPFKYIIAKATAEQLDIKVKEMSERVESMRLKFMCEDFCGSEDSPKSLSSVSTSASSSPTRSPRVQIHQPQTRKVPCALSRSRPIGLLQRWRTAVGGGTTY
jgi:hypothetical protein